MVTAASGGSAGYLLPSHSSTGRASGGGGDTAALVTSLGNGVDLSLATDKVVVLPVLVLTEGPTVPGNIAPRACLTCLSPAVPATLQLNIINFINLLFNKIIILSALNDYQNFQ